MTRAQLSAAGLSHSGIRSRAARGRLAPVHRGIYAIGHTVLTSHGRLLAAVLACGADALASHRSAAWLGDLRPSASRTIDVTSPRRAGRGLPDVIVHRGTTIHADDRTVQAGVPCTSVARTLVDLGAVVDRRSVERACERAEVLKVFDLGAIEAALRRAGPTRGAARLRDVLGTLGEPAGTHSELEERFLALCSAHRIPPPIVNGRLPLPPHAAALWPSASPPEGDFVWPDARLVVETDGRETHLTPAAFERDRLKDQCLSLAGWRVVRFTRAQVSRRPADVAATVRALVGA